MKAGGALYIIRHGQTDGQVSGKLRGKAHDDQLNATGIEQAKQVAAQLKDVKFDKCFCSPMTRAQQTAEIVYKGKIQLDPRLLPRDYGTLVESVARGLDQSEGIWRRGAKYSNGVETIENMELRISDFFKEIIKKYPDKNLLIVTHSSVSRIIKGFFQGLPENNDYANYSVLGNTEIMKIDMQGL